MQKIAVLGGGIGSLGTVLEITSDPNWQQNYDITVYQMGWRCGGKGASGRNRAVNDRIEEHGIHLWMGFYENAFRAMRKVYDEAHQKNLMPHSPFTDVRKAFSPMRYTPMMEEYKGKWYLWPVEWPGSDDEFPGEDTSLEDQKLPPGPLEFVHKIIGFVVAHLDSHREKHPLLTELYQFGVANVSNAISGAPELPDHAVPSQPHTLLHRVLAFIGELHADVTIHLTDEHHSILGWIRRFLDKVFDLVEGVLEEDAELRHIIIIMDTALSAVIGILEDDVVNKGFMSIEDQDFIDWLAKHGCRHAKSPITIGLHDGVFAYQHGQPKLMRVGAGSALYCGLRLLFTYKGALMYWMNAGMGETIFSPIYLVLRERGVKFEFFHKVTNLGLSADQTKVDHIEVDVQATVRDGKPYDPLFLGVDGIPVWPTEPDWPQIVEADAIKACKNPDLESWWTDWKGAGKKTLQLGRDFDLVVLGIPIGAHKYICKELIAGDKTGGWQRMHDHLETVRTQGLQLWLNEKPVDSGWTHARGVMCGYVELFDTWSDMTDLIQRERWPASANVQQIAYLCNVIPEDPNQAPFTDPGYPEAQLQQVKANARAFMDKYASAIWPNLRDPQNPAKFNDEALVNGFQDPAVSNFDAQFFKINIDPSELYNLTLPGTAQYRLRPGKSGFQNLFLAGDWTFNDLNMGCIEATVMSAMMASKAICGHPDHIYVSFGAQIPIED